MTNEELVAKAVENRKAFVRAADEADRLDEEYQDLFREMSNRGLAAAFLMPDVSRRP